MFDSYNKSLYCVTPLVIAAVLHVRFRLVSRPLSAELTHMSSFPSSKYLGFFTAMAESWKNLKDTIAFSSFSSFFFFFFVFYNRNRSALMRELLSNKLVCRSVVRL